MWAGSLNPFKKSTQPQERESTPPSLVVKQERRESTPSSFNKTGSALLGQSGPALEDVRKTSGSPKIGRKRRDRLRATSGPLGANVTVSSAPCSCGSSCGAVCRVRVNAPWPSCIIMGCNLKGGDPIGGLGLIRRLEGFIAHAWNETERSPTRYKAGLVRRLNRNFALVASVVKAHPCLRLDFQVFLRSDGEVFNVDLDRCFDRSSSAVSPLSNRFEISEAHIDSHQKFVGA